jgi:UDP-3-O-[3-hydroxymyristoyl] glucosamine N-acyltransferase
MFLRDLQLKFGGEAIGEILSPLIGVGTIDGASPAHITFLANPRYRAALASTEAGAVILAPRDQNATTKPRIVTENPYAYFAKVAQHFSPAVGFPAGIHSSAIVHPSARVHATASVAEFVSIGPEADIGENVRIGPGCVVGEQVTIGAGSQLVARVCLYSRTRMGERALVHAGVVIGADGFGFAPAFTNREGQWIKIPQTGRVVIGDDCEIGANTTIDRGAIEDTLIGNDVKIDNQVQIGHNSQVGDHTVISGCVGIAGSTKIGKRVMIGGAAGAIGHLEIGDDVIVSAMTLVTKSITEPGVYTSGTPLMPHREWLKNAAHLRHLDEMSDAIKHQKKMTESRTTESRTIKPPTKKTDRGEKK